ncbi:N-acetyltransferase family protein [Kitasatospora paranensis]|uniref:N-acetyltransferase family protein n=1 Tax=Kitasatospora paranensis TaxID=258053 RepID=A0ABW2FSQ5_9ACTN
MTAAHAEAVLAIYQAGIDEGNATFETTAPAWPVFDAARLPEHRWVAVDHDGTVLGWVAVSAVSSRCVYAGVVEHSVYVHPDAQGRGVGRMLLDAVITSTEAAGIWTIQSGIFPENHASLALHRRAGFRVIGTRERVGRQHGVWRDVMLLERRSSVI